jgi:hypothetical protein
MNYLQSSPAIKNPHDRVRNHSPKSLNKTIDREIDYLVKITIEKGPFAIRQRLSDLDKEWDLDRALMLLYSGALILQLGNALKNKNKKSLWLPLLQSSFILLHATYGWSPAILLLRKLGFRTRFEIQTEREDLLKALSVVEKERPEKHFPISEWDVYGSV